MSKMLVLLQLITSVGYTHLYLRLWDVCGTTLSIWHTRTHLYHGWIKGRVMVCVRWPSHGCMCVSSVNAGQAVLKPNLSFVYPGKVHIELVWTCFNYFLHCTVHAVDVSLGDGKINFVDIFAISHKNLNGVCPLVDISTNNRAPKPHADHSKAFRYSWTCFFTIHPFGLSYMCFTLHWVRVALFLILIPRCSFGCLLIFYRRPILLSSTGKLLVPLVSFL